MAHLVKTSYGRVYRILGGPYTGNNGTFYVVEDVHDGIIDLKSKGIVDGLEDAGEGDE